MGQFNSLPKEPEKRRAILVLSDTDIEQLSHEPGGADLLLNRQVSLLDISTQGNNSLVEKLSGSGLLNPGSLLIQSPYNPSDYADVTDAPYSFAQAKCIHFATLCGLLAAKKVSVEHMEIQTSDGRTKFSGNLNTPYGKGNIEGERRAWERMRKEIKLERQYGEVEPKLDKAKDYLRKHQWLTDAHMNSLVELRDAGVPIEKEKFTLSVTKESQKNLDVALSLHVPVYIKELNGKIEQIKNESFEFSLTIEVEFW